MRVDLCSLYRFYMYDLARELNDRGLLHKLFTGLPRAHTSLPRSVVRSRLRLTATRRVVGTRFPSVDYPLLCRAIADFDKWVTRQLDGSEIVTALSAHASHSLVHARSQGSKIVCDRGSWHILETERVLEAEAVKWGVDHQRFDNWGVDRELSDYATADLIVVPSTTAQRSFERQGIDKTRTAVINFGVNLNAFNPGPEERRDSKRIVSVGNIGLRKGQLHLLTAYERVRGSGTSLLLLGRTEPQIRVLLDQFTRDDISIQYSPRQEVVRHLHGAGIFVLASVEEGLPLSLVQAMATGLPIIATAATGAEDVLTHDQEGLIVPASDTNALTDALSNLLNDPNRAAGMGRLARERVERSGGWESYAAAYCANYARLVQ